MVLVCLKKQESKKYEELKRFLLQELKISNQFVLTSSFKKNSLSVASKVGIQMNAKIGGVPWEIGNSNNYIKSKKFFYGAISTSKTSNTHTISFVGTVSPSCTKIYSNYWSGVKKKENIPN